MKAVQIIVVIFSTIILSINGSDDEFIIGGTPIVSTTVTYQASIRSDESGHICSGAIIADRYFLTTARCALLSFNYVRVGSNLLNARGTRYYIEKKIVHRNYQPVNSINDIALLKTNATIRFDENVQLIRLPLARFPDNTSILMTGWGVRSYPRGVRSINLLRLITTSISKNRCSTMLGTNASDSQLCTFVSTGRACYGDYGNPLVARNALHGIVSRIHPTCSLETPDISTRVFGFRAWIRAMMMNN